MRTLYKLSVPTSPHDEDATVELLQDYFQISPCVETDLEKGSTHVSVYLNASPDRAPLKRLIPRFLLRKLAHENWAESWKRHFKPIEIGPQLMIKPGWSRRKPKRNQAVVVLDPGLSFGTGQHPTTRFCLEQIVKFRRTGEKQQFLDVGTGSGILAIAAARLGYVPVHAFDFDPDAVRIAKANAKKNKVALHRLSLRRLDAINHPLKSQTYDLVCANLLADLLVAERGWLIDRLKPGGRLVIAGILKLQFGDVKKAYEKAGLRMIASRVEKEWRSGAFEFARQKIPTK